ncbi:hypothetical protein EDB85DRAFT_1899200 [Lactarius pseudohatsudake]|nr:hypothetical protein EDB85DRAFT_1899200 [Lactarius pseudohatsudake]
MSGAIAMAKAGVSANRRNWEREWKRGVGKRKPNEMMPFVVARQDDGDDLQVPTVGPNFQDERAVREEEGENQTVISESKTRGLKYKQDSSYPDRQNPAPDLTVAHCQTRAPMVSYGWLKDIESLILTLKGIWAMRRRRGEQRCTRRKGVRPGYEGLGSLLQGEYRRRRSMGNERQWGK